MSYTHCNHLSKKTLSDLAETIKVSIFADNSLRIYTVRHGNSGDVRIDASQAGELIRKIRAEIKRGNLIEDAMDAADATEAEQRLNDPKEKPISYAKVRKMLAMGEKSLKKKQRNRP